MPGFEMYDSDNRVTPETLKHLLLLTLHQLIWVTLVARISICNKMYRYLDTNANFFSLLVV